MAIHTLIELTNDQNDLVRDWATFGLGSQIHADTQQIREALFARLFDGDEVVRGEALVGLALRKDERIIEPLIKELARYQDAKYGGFGVEAAEEIADTRLLPILTNLKQSTGAATFDEAISCCSE